MEIPHLAVLRSQIRAAGETEEDKGDPRQLHAMALHLDLEQLPYNLSAAYHAVRQMEGLSAALLDAYRPPVAPPQRVSLMLPPDQALALAGLVDQFLDSARRAQNSMTRYVSKTFRVSISNSLSDMLASKKPQRKVPDAVYRLLREYWDNGGRTLKDYRDLGQHHAIVASDAHVHAAPDGSMGLHLLLPVNPQDRGVAQQSYGPPYVHALSYCRASFLDLFSAAYRLTFLLLRYVGYCRQVTMFVTRSAIAFADATAFVGAPVEPLEDAVWAARKNVAAESKATFGELEDEPLPAPPSSVPS